MISCGRQWLPTWPVFKGSSRDHTESDLRCCLAWCTEHGLDPLAARRLHLELYIRWMQETRRFQPSTVSRRLSVATVRRSVPERAGHARYDPCSVAPAGPARSL
jgi:hypothetical protein